MDDSDSIDDDIPHSESKVEDDVPAEVEVNGEFLHADGTVRKADEHTLTQMKVTRRTKTVRMAMTKCML